MVVTLYEQQFSEAMQYLLSVQPKPDDVLDVFEFTRVYIIDNGGMNPEDRVVKSLTPVMHDALISIGFERVYAEEQKQWDREGTHSLLGALVTYLYLDGSSLELLLTVTGLFLLYEIREHVKINDWAWRDIGGYLTGIVSMWTVHHFFL